MTDLFEAEAPATTTSLDLRRVQRLQRRATRRKWTLVAVSVGIVLFSLAGSVAYNFATDTLESTDTAAADYPDAGQGTVQVIIEPGDRGSDIATTLFENDVIASREAFLTAWDASSDATSIKPGYYFLQHKMKASFALEALLDPANRDLRKITVIEGKTLPVYYQKIADVTGYTLEEVEEAAKDTEALGLPAEAGNNLEGWLFPDTYEFNPNVTPSEVMRAMIERTIQVLNDEGVAPADREKILTIASLIEREAGLPEDRPMISGVIYNRLDRGMRLELDSTVQYLHPSDTVFTTAEERADPSEYNTYQHTGLPPGPIAGAGQASIEAAVHPASHNYVFFVTVNLETKETAYAETLAQHQVNVQKFQQWVADTNYGDDE